MPTASRSAALLAPLLIGSADAAFARTSRFSQGGFHQTTPSRTPGRAVSRTRSPRTSETSPREDTRDRAGEPVKNRSFPRRYLIITNRGRSRRTTTLRRSPFAGVFQFMVSNTQATLYLLISSISRHFYYIYTVFHLKERFNGGFNEFAVDFLSATISRDSLFHL